MLTTNINHLETEAPIDILSGRFLDRINELLKYARKAQFSGNRTEITEATLRDIGISKYQINGVSNKSRFDDELDRLQVQGSTYLPR